MSKGSFLRGKINEKFCFFILTLSLFNLNPLRADPSLPPPYNTVKLLPNDLRGWYSNAKPIQTIFTKRNPKIVIEVGCWLGLSAIHMASVISPEGVIYAVDHWLGCPEQQPGQSFWDPILPKAYQQFLSNVIHAKQCDKIIPVRMSSLEGSEFLAGIQADLVYIDASHDYDSVYADLNAWFPFVKGHGILCGDDSPHPPIQQALSRFAAEQGLKVSYVEDTRFWYLTDELTEEFYP